MIVCGGLPAGEWRVFFIIYFVLVYFDSCMSVVAGWYLRVRVYSLGTLPSTANTLPPLPLPLLLSPNFPAQTPSRSPHFPWHPP